MNAKDYLSSLALALNAARKADPLGLTSSICGIRDNVFISLTDKAIRLADDTFKREVAEWFAEGELTSYTRTDVPYGERKNSKKRSTTTFYNATRDGLTCQLGHTTTLNYSPDWMERAVRSMVDQALNKVGEFSYYNNSFVAHVLSMGKTFKDLGEKK